MNQDEGRAAPLIETSNLDALVRERYLCHTFFLVTPAQSLANTHPVRR